MITFKQFLTEDSAFDIETFAKDCAPFFRKAGAAITAGSAGETATSHKSFNLFFHGGKFAPDGVEIATFSPRLKPRDTPIDVHNVFNETFDQHFGVEARNWMFVTGDSRHAYAYAKSLSNLFAIFPIGDFEWLCSTSSNKSDLTEWHGHVIDAIERGDIFLTHDGQWGGIKDDPTYENRNLSQSDVRELAIEYVKDHLVEDDWNFNKNLQTCLSGGNEIMLHPNKFYAVAVGSDTFVNEIIPFLQTL